LRAALLKLRPDDHILICTMHHIISDAWSAGVFVRELAGNYEAFSRRIDYRPEPLQFQYGDSTIWQREYSHSDIFQRQLEYWKKKLVGSPPVLKLPYDHPRPPGRTSEGWSQTIRLDPALAGRLKVIAQDNGATFFILMLTAFNVLLYRYTAEPDILIGVPVAGRNHVETESLIGLFVNTLVLRTDLSGNPRFSTLLAQVRDTMLEALANQAVPLEKIVQELQPVRSLSYNPVFQVMFATFKGAVRSRSFGDLKASPYVINTATSRLDLSAALIEGTDGHWWIQLEYSTALFDHDRILRLLGHYEQLLCSIARTIP
ncbi:MAG: condensation domain-containing protein, partial [Acidobacteriota bacterium]|nr:condensation domain-containing protein [Acidobacteriota bacterium]